MKCITYSGSGTVTTLVNGQMVRISKGDNHMDDAIAEGAMKNFKNTRFEKQCELKAAAATAKKAVAKKAPVAKKATAKKTTTKKATKEKTTKKK